MSTIRDWMTIAEGLRPAPRARLKEAILYRGDATKVDRFSLDKTLENALFGIGIYLTDSPAVASDYTFSKGSEHVVFSLEADQRPTVRDLMLDYLRKLIDDQGWDKRKTELRDHYMRLAGGLPDHIPRDEASMHAYWHRTNDEREKWSRKVQDDFQAALKKEYAAFLTRAKAQLKKERDGLRVVKDTMGGMSLVKSGRTGSVSRFDIPDEYLARTFHAERPLPDDVLGIVKSVITGKYGDGVLDMRDEEYQSGMTFDDWVANFKARGTLYSSEYHKIGGKGVNPTLDEVVNGTIAGKLSFGYREWQVKFIAAMQAVGYVGIEYQGGIRIGANNPRGGGGVLHRAFVLWDEAAVNGFRIDDHALPPDEEVDAGHLKGVRTTAIAGTRHGYH